MTLREEIGKRIIEVMTTDFDTEEQGADDIIKMFERLIDKIMARYPYYTEAFYELKDELEK